jgi:hypothetical protein
MALQNGSNYELSRLQKLQWTIWVSERSYKELHMFSEQTAICTAGTFNRDKRRSYVCKEMNAVFLCFVTDPGFHVGFTANIKAHKITGCENPCGGGVEYLHRDPASRKRRRNGTKKGRAIA